MECVQSFVYTAKLIRIELLGVELDKVASQMRLSSCATTKVVPLFQATEWRSGYAEELPKWG
jgi:hypothetical protein